MPVTIELTPPLYQQVDTLASSRGQSVPTFLLSLIHNSVMGEKNESTSRTWEESTDKIMEEHSELWERLAKL